MKLIMQKRMFTGKKFKLTPEEREEKLNQIAEERDNFEKANLGKFRMIYPCEDPEKMQTYDELLKGSHEIWETITYGKNRRKITTQGPSANHKDSSNGGGGAATINDT